MCHVDLLVFLGFKPWVFHHAPGCGTSLGFFLETTLDEVLEVFAPFDAMIRFIFQLGYWLPYDVGQEINQAGSWLHLGPVCWERKAVLGDLEERDAKGPNIGGNGVGLPLYPLWGHVV